ncbi:MAG: hypothetical protein JXD22_16385 [Sedimentisphaerales bacterium]|nr:hypothetical protein [Sedimentisphaerales bacterium]
MITNKIRFPIGSSDFAVDNTDKIVCYSGQFRRIQIFNLNNELINGWFVPTSSQVGEVRFDESGEIHLITGFDEHYIFNYEGEIISKKKEEGKYEIYYSKAYKPHRTDSNGNSYHRQINTFSVEILMKDSNGIVSVVISDPFYIWPLRGNAIFIICVIPGLILGVNYYIKKKRDEVKKEQMNESVP